MEEYIVYIVLGVVLIVATIVNRLCDEVFPIIWIVGGIIGLVCGKLEIGMVSLKESMVTLISLYIITWLAIFIVKGLANMLGGATIKGYWMCSVFLGRYVAVAIALFFIYIVIKGKTIKRDEIDEYLLSPRTIPVIHIIGITVLITIVIIKFFNII